MSKWLLRKTSGSRSRYKSDGDYSDNRHARKSIDLESSPQSESMRGKNHHNTYLDTTLVKRWLYSKVGEDFDIVYSEFLTRIQPKYLDEYRHCIYWYVEKKENVEVKENGEVWSNWHGKSVKLLCSSFYVDPETNELRKLE